MRTPIGGKYLSTRKSEKNLTVWLRSLTQPGDSFRVEETNVNKHTRTHPKYDLRSTISREHKDGDKMAEQLRQNANTNPCHRRSTCSARECRLAERILFFCWV
uniref:(northern house mosquito) hypothetical protein n=1 Tax=Culex pipiens TaxID=7175 RepID=A0A8D8E8M7_CULPI